MSLYPSLEDMRVDQMAQAQRNHERAITGSDAPMAHPSAPMQYPHPQVGHVPAMSASALYPQLSEYMGLALTDEQVKQMQLVPSGGNQVGVRQTPSGHSQIAPITGNNVGLARAEIKSGIRLVTLCKDQDNKLGLRLRHVNNGVFVAFVQRGSPSAMAGLRFGDQILQIDNNTIAGWDNDKVHKFLKKADAQKIEMAVRDRPFERTITMQKDSNGFIGFMYKDGMVKSLVKDSSAARNGMLTDHMLCEIGGQNVIGLKDKEIGEIIDSQGRTVTLTIMPKFIYEHITKCMGSSIVKKLMDHSIPDL